MFCFCLLEEILGLERCCCAAVVGALIATYRAAILGCGEGDAVHTGADLFCWRWVVCCWVCCCHWGGFVGGLGGDHF
jgi:hypothetical protein